MMETNWSAPIDYKNVGEDGFWQPPTLSEWLRKNTTVGVIKTGRDDGSLILSLVSFSGDIELSEEVRDLYHLKDYAVRGVYESGYAIKLVPKVLQDSADLLGCGDAGFIIKAICTEISISDGDPEDNLDLDKNLVEIKELVYDVKRGFRLLDSNGNQYKLVIKKERELNERLSHKTAH